METHEFLSATKKLMDDAERAELVLYLAYNPTAGDVIPGSGGVQESCVGGWTGAASEAERA